MQVLTTFDIAVAWTLLVLIVGSFLGAAIHEWWLRRVTKRRRALALSEEELERKLEQGFTWQKFGRTNILVPPPPPAPFLRVVAPKDYAPPRYDPS